MRSLSCRRDSAWLCPMPENVGHGGDGGDDGDDGSGSGDDVG